MRSASNFVLVLKVNITCADCFCTFILRPVCGEDGKVYSNRCIAECANVTVAYDGPCDDGAPHRMYPSVTIHSGTFLHNPLLLHPLILPCWCTDTITCEKGVQTAACFVDPCLGQTCPSDPNATCISNYCPGITRFRGTYVSGPCTTVFVDADGGKPVDCCEEQLSNVT